MDGGALAKVVGIEGDAGVEQGLRIIRFCWDDPLHLCDGADRGVYVVRFEPLSATVAYPNLKKDGVDPICTLKSALAADTIDSIESAHLDLISAGSWGVIARPPFRIR